MASRLAYAVAFRAVREVLVLDEIFAVGDAGFRARCEERYRQLHRDGHTVSSSATIRGSSLRSARGPSSWTPDGSFSRALVKKCPGGI